MSLLNLDFLKNIKLKKLNSNSKLMNIDKLNKIEGENSDTQNYIIQENINELKGNNFNGIDNLKENKNMKNKNKNNYNENDMIIVDLTEDISIPIFNSNEENNNTFDISTEKKIDKIYNKNEKRKISNNISNFLFIFFSENTTTNFNNHAKLPLEPINEIEIVENNENIQSNENTCMIQLNTKPQKNNNSLNNKSSEKNISYTDSNNKNELNYKTKNFNQKFFDYKNFTNNKDKEYLRRNPDEDNSPINEGGERKKSKRLDWIVKEQNEKYKSADLSFINNMTTGDANNGIKFIFNNKENNISKLFNDEDNFLNKNQELENNLEINSENKNNLEYNPFTLNTNTNNQIKNKNLLIHDNKDNIFEYGKNRKNNIISDININKEDSINSEGEFKFQTLENTFEDFSSIKNNNQNKNNKINLDILIGNYEKNNTNNKTNINDSFNNEKNKLNNGNNKNKKNGFKINLNNSNIELLSKIII